MQIPLWTYPECNVTVCVIFWFAYFSVVFCTHEIYIRRRNNGVWGSQYVISMYITLIIQLCQGKYSFPVYGTFNRYYIYIFSVVSITATDWWRTMDNLVLQFFTEIIIIIIIINHIEITRTKSCKVILKFRASFINSIYTLWAFIFTLSIICLFALNCNRVLLYFMLQSDAVRGLADSLKNCLMCFFCTADLFSHLPVSCFCRETIYSLYVMIRKMGQSHETQDIWLCGWLRIDF